VTAGARADELVAGGVFQPLGLQPARRTHRRRRHGNRLRHLTLPLAGYTASPLCQCSSTSGLLSAPSSLGRFGRLNTTRSVMELQAGDWVEPYHPRRPAGRPRLTPKAVGGARPVVPQLQLTIE
jgi:hypothetical protein